MQEGTTPACQPGQGPQLPSAKSVIAFKQVIIVKAKKEIHMPGIWFSLCSAFS